MSEKLLPLFGNLTHGVYVIGVSAIGRKNAFTAAWVMQSSFDPPFELQRSLWLRLIKPLVS